MSHHEPDIRALEIELEILEADLNDQYQAQAKIAKSIATITSQINDIRFELSGQTTLPFGDTLAG